jgi:hypothetical protein
MFVVYGFECLVRVWFVSIVLTLVVDCILSFFFFTDSRGSTLYIFLYVSFV